jgi:hypothetical protein
VLLLVVALLVIVARDWYLKLPGRAVVVLVDSEQFQQIHGWEANAESGLEDTSSQEYLDELLDAAMDLGLSRLRVEVRSSYEHRRNIEEEFRAKKLTVEEYRCARYSTINDNDDPWVLNESGFRFERLDRLFRSVVMPLKTRMDAAGERLAINVNYVAFTDQLCGDNAYVHDQPEEYAEFVLAVYQHLQKTFGIVPDFWEVMLEPDTTRLWDGPLLARVMAAAASRLTKAGFTPAFIAPSTTKAGHALQYFQPIWDQTALRPYIREFSYHRYGGYTGEGVIREIGDTARARHVPTAMLEKIGAGYEELMQDLTVGGVSAWQQYTLAFPERDSGGHYFVIDPEAPKGRQITLSRSARYLREFFRAARPGAVRVGATTTSSAFRPVAFKNPDGRHAVVVEARRPGEITIQQLPPGNYAVSCWTEASRLDEPASRCAASQQVDAAGTLVVPVPAPGVVSVLEVRGKALD